MSGPPRELLRPRHWPSWLGLGLLSLGILLPRRWRDSLAARLGDRRYRRHAKARETVELNLACCFPDWSDEERRRVAREHFRAFTRALADQPLFWWDRNGRRIGGICRVHGLDHLDRARADGQPVILLSPHVTGIAFGGVALARHAGLSTMANRYPDPVLQWVEHCSRVRHGPVFLREDGIRPVVRELRAGSVFYYMPDEDLGPRDSVFAPFFGMEKASLTSLGRLARLARAKVVPMMTCYNVEQRRYEVELRAPLPDFPSGDDGADARTMNAALEESIRRCPAQYLWNQRLFLSRPDGSRMAYPKRAHRR